MPLAVWCQTSVALCSCSCSPAAFAWAFAVAAPCASVRPTAVASSGTAHLAANSFGRCFRRRAQPFELRQNVRPPCFPDVRHRRVGDAVVAAQHIAQDLLGLGRTAELLVDQREVVANEGLARQVALRAIERTADA